MQLSWKHVDSPKTRGRTWRPAQILVTPARVPSPSSLSMQLLRSRPMRTAQPLSRQLLQLLLHRPRSPTMLQQSLACPVRALILPLLLCAAAGGVLAVPRTCRGLCQVAELCLTPTAIHWTPIAASRATTIRPTGADFNRTCLPGRKGGRGQGRPIGLLLAWLQAGDHHDS